MQRLLSTANVAAILSFTTMYDHLRCASVCRLMHAAASSAQSWSGTYIAMSAGALLYVNLYLHKYRFCPPVIAIHFFYRMCYDFDVDLDHKMFRDPRTRELRISVPTESTAYLGLKMSSPLTNIVRLAVSGRFTPPEAANLPLLEQLTIGPEVGDLSSFVVSRLVGYPALAVHCVGEADPVALVRQLEPVRHIVRGISGAFTARTLAELQDFKRLEWVDLHLWQFDKQLRTLVDAVKLVPLRGLKIACPGEWSPAVQSLVDRASIVHFQGWWHPALLKGRRAPCPLVRLTRVHSCGSKYEEFRGSTKPAVAGRYEFSGMQLSQDELACFRKIADVKLWCDFTLP